MCRTLVASEDTCYEVAMDYLCPVCGYPALEFPPKDYNICPCCSTEFDYHDVGFTHAELRQMWIERGAPWWDEDTPVPPFWNPVEQLRNIGYEATERDLATIAHHRETSYQAAA